MGPGEGLPTPGGVAKALGTNPLILACLVGGVLAALPQALPSAVADALALLAVQPAPGALGRGGGAPGAPESHGASASGGQQRGAVCGEAGPGPRPRRPWPAAPLQGVLLMLFCVPTATSAYILAQQLGGDGPATPAVITGQAVLALGVTPLL